MRAHGPSGAVACAAALLLLLVGTASAAPLPRRSVRPRSCARAAALLQRGGAWPDADGDPYGTEAPAAEWEEDWARTCCTFSYKSLASYKCCLRNGESSSKVIPRDLRKTAKF